MIWITLDALILLTYYRQCFPRGSSNSCLYQVYSVRAKNQSRVRAHESSRACIRNHCQWRAMSYDRVLYQPHTNSC